MKLTIIGASGHGKVVADIALKCGYTDIFFLDDNKSLKNCGRWPVIGGTETSFEGDIFVAIGNATLRREFFEKFSNMNIVTLIHPNAVIAEDVIIGKGSVVMAGAVINSSSIIGEGCIINTCSSVDHDCFIGNYTHISVGAHLCGTVNVGETSWISAGSCVINNISICSRTIIGAGSVVINDILSPGTYIGIPAKKLK